MNEYTRIRIVLADDDDLFRDGFRALIAEEKTIELVAEAADGYSLINKVMLHEPDVVLTDVRMPGLGGIAATEQLVEKFPGVSIIALSMFNDDHLLIDMLAAGASGYLLKGAGKKMIIDAIHSVHRSVPFYCHQTGMNLSRLIATNVYDPLKKERKTLLTDRESDVLKLLCMEKTNAQIAKDLGISLRTVEGVRLKLLAKTKTKNLIGLYKFAIGYGLVEGG